MTRPATTTSRRPTPAVPFPVVVDHPALTRRALDLPRWPEPFWDVLELLRDFREPALRVVSRRGASYRQLARISYEAGFGRTLRYGWYRVAEEIPLSEAHAAHLLQRLQEASS